MSESLCLSNPYGTSLYASAVISGIVCVCALDPKDLSWRLLSSVSSRSQVGTANDAWVLHHGFLLPLLAVLALLIASLYLCTPL